MKPYTERKSKDANMMNRRQGMMQAEHNSKNAFVKRSEDALQAKYGAHAPVLDDMHMQFNAEMVSDGEHACHLGAEVTKGLDEMAYPLRKKRELY